MGSLIQNVNEEIYKNSKELYQIGESSLTPLIEAVLPHDWSKIDNKGQMRLLTGIVALINDINEEACHKTAQSIIEKGCTRAVKQCLNSITKFTLNDYSSYDIHNAKIYIFKDFKDTEYIKIQLEEWLSIVPKEDIKEIERIYVIPYHEDYAYSGTYMPVLSYITLVWDLENTKSKFWKWANKLMTKHTLYHEFGHHSAKHTFGQDEEQENEADRYANVLMRKAHPSLNIMAKTLKSLGLRKKQVD